jgi:hypothetical protein
MRYYSRQHHGGSLLLTSTRRLTKFHMWHCGSGRFAAQMATSHPSVDQRSPRVSLRFNPNAIADAHGCQRDSAFICSLCACSGCFSRVSELFESTTFERLVVALFAIPKEAHEHFKKFHLSKLDQAHLHLHPILLDFPSRPCGLL